MEANSRLSSAAALPCGHENPDDNAFCDVCGGSRPRRHVRQAVNRDTANFCGRCGVRLTESSMSDGAPESSAEAQTTLQTHGVSREITVREAGSAVANSVSVRPSPEGGRAARGSGPPAPPEPRVVLESGKGAVAMDRSKDKVRPVTELAHNPRVTRPQSSRFQSEGHRPIRPDGDEAQGDPQGDRLPAECQGRAEKRRRQLERLLVEYRGLDEKRRRRRRALRWGILAAAALYILLLAIVFAGRGGNGSRSAPPRLEPSLAPARSKAPPAASQPPPGTDRPSPAEPLPIPVVPESPPPPDALTPPLPAEDPSTPPGNSNRGTAPLPHSAAAVDSLHVIAGNLIARVGRERAEKTAQANATLYAPGSENFIYWQRVADAIRTAEVPR
jgi:hypothetical protein